MTRRQRYRRRAERFGFAWRHSITQRVPFKLMREYACLAAHFAIAALEIAE